MNNQTGNTNQTDVSISSSDGWNSIIIKFKKSFQSNKIDLIKAELELSGSFWEREQSSLEAAIVDDYKVHLPQILLAKNKLKEFIQMLENWLSKYTECSINLSGTIDQQVDIFIGQRDDFISSIHEPVFSLNYSSSRMKAEWCFTTDQSCINILLEELRVAMLNIDSIKRN